LETHDGKHGEQEVENESPNQICEGKYWIFKNILSVQIKIN
jgi:hypothetical protein